MLRNILVLMLFLLLTACASNTVPLQPGDNFYKSTLKVNKPYVVAPTFWMLGFNFPATDYKAFMKDNKGVYFSSPTPLMATDKLAGTVYRTGGLYYQINQKKVFFYLLDTSEFAGSYVSKEPLTGLNYEIIK